MDRDSPEHIEKHCDRDTEDGRARDRSLRVFHVAGRDGRRFESKIGKHRQRCQGCRGSQQGLAAGVELTEMRRIDVEQTNDRDRPERYHFRIGHKLGKEASRLDAAQIDQHHSPDGRQRQHRRHDPTMQAGKHVDDGAGKGDRNNRE